MTTLYCTVQDVRNALTSGGKSVESTTYDSTGKTAASMADWQIEDAIVEAMTLVKSFLLKRYKIVNEDVEEPRINPDGTVDDPPVLITVNVAPQPVRAWTRSLAAWYATLTDRQGKDLEERDPIQLRKDQVLQSLLQVANRTLDLDLTLSDDGSGSGVSVVNVYEGNLFTLEDFGLAQTGGRQVLVPVRWPWW